MHISLHLAPLVHIGYHLHEQHENAYMSRLVGLPSTSISNTFIVFSDPTVFALYYVNQVILVRMSEY